MGTELHSLKLLVYAITLICFFKILKNHCLISILSLPVSYPETTYLTQFPLSKGGRLLHPLLLSASPLQLPSSKMLVEMNSIP